ncbi:MAG: GNAT family N-acetyltransferase [Brevundimonas sp.]|uniref:GNAT family N-acetyltransferase n=1 Tax=Brevundimonas sp. TaxID=1871086 RepID=UPI003002935E
MVSMVANLSFTLRAYVAADAGHLAQLYYDSARILGSRRYTPEQVAVWAPAPVSPETVHARTMDGRLTMVACAPTGQRLAYGDLEPNGHIDHLYAHPDAAGRGVAKALLDRLIEVARESGISHLHVEASELARGLFERAGFYVMRRREFEINGVLIHNYAMLRRS